MRCFISIVAVSIAPLLHAQSALELGKTLDRQLVGGESHEYQFSAQSDQFVAALIRQSNMKLDVSAFAPDGRKVFDVKGQTPGDDINIEFIGEAAGQYRIRITAADAAAAPGHYSINFALLEAATEKYRQRIAGWRAQAEANKAWLPHKREGVIQAIALLEQAAGNWHSAEEPINEASALYSIGRAYIELGEKEKAIEYLSRALPIAKASQNTVTEAWALDSLGLVYVNFGDRQKAVEYFDEALALMRTAGIRAGEAHTSNDLGMAYARMGDKHRALEYFDQAASIFRELKDQRLMGIVLSNIGYTYAGLGEYQRALESYQRSLEIRRQTSDRSGEAITLNNIGAAWSSLGDYQKALDSYRQSLEIHRSLGRRWDSGILQHNIAWIYNTLGDTARALTYYQEALVILREVKDQSGLSNTLNNLGDLSYDRGDYGKAIEFYTGALSLRRTVKDRDGEAVSLANMAKCYARIGERQKAREHFDDAMKILRDTGYRRRLDGVLRYYGALEREGGNWQKAVALLDEALQISRDIQDRRGETEALGELARLELSRGDFEKAHQRATEALAGFEALRLTVASPTLRASFFTAAREIQEVDLDVLTRLHDGAAALLTAERGRARSLLEMLGEATTEIRRGVDPAMLARERDLVQLISGKAEKGVTGELAALTTELEELQGRIRETSPTYASLTQPVPLNLEQIQTRVLDPETVLLEYSLGSARSLLWAVTPSSMDVFELPPRAQVEAAAKRVYDLLTARNRKLAAARVQQADEAYPGEAAKLSAMLLGPAAAKLENKRLLIVAEGVLQYLPFGVLPEPGKATPLIVNHEIVNAPSASVLAVLRKETAGRRPAEKAAAILADPVFSRDDPRIASTVATRSLLDEHFLRLRFSRVEAEEIARLAPVGSTLKALDFEASRETALKPELAQYRIVHFATHSVLNDEHPDLSGVVLSLVDRAGKPQDGFLRLYDIYNLRLAADLVVLSACRTALGGEIKGEGLIGLTRGFLYAGAPRVVATLWEIDDRTTSEVMKRFYQAMLGHGERPAAALRAAQVAMWKMKGWDAPYYWAAFTLQGEWR